MSHVFIPDDADVWIIAEIDSLEDGFINIRPDSVPGVKKKFYASHETLPIGDYESLQEMPSDLIKLVDVHRGGVLHTLRKRYDSDLIYTSIGPVLVSINPFKWITNLYASGLIAKYDDGEYDLASSPHVFAMAKTALDGLSQGYHQSLIISGESGSGKTEATKQCLLYFTLMTQKRSKEDHEKAERMSESRRSIARSVRKSITASEINEEEDSPSINNDADSGKDGHDDEKDDEEPILSSSSKMRQKVGRIRLDSLLIGNEDESSVQTRILSAAPILEAFGNAKTLRNNNSSRFGKFIELWFGKGQRCIEKSVNTTYLLEKTRVVSQEANERNYHIFYQFLRGSDSATLESLALTDISHDPLTSNYVGCGGCVDVEGEDDVMAWADLLTSFTKVGFTDEDVDNVTKLLAAIIHIGQLKFVSGAGDTLEVTGATSTHLLSACECLGMESETFRQVLLYKALTTTIAKRKSVTLSPYTAAQAKENRDATSKEIYTRLFDYIVDKINLSINLDSDGNATKISPSNTSNSRTAYKDGRGMIGILDIFGFEIFEKNSLEQLCINLANEHLQQHFNYHIFKGEMAMYDSENIKGVVLDYADNKDVLDLILNKSGVFSMLDEEGMLPRGSDDGFSNKLKSKHDGQSRRFKWTFKTKVSYLRVHMLQWLLSTFHPSRSDTLTSSSPSPLSPPLLLLSLL